MQESDVELNHCWIARNRRGSGSVQKPEYKKKSKFVKLNVVWYNPAEYGVHRISYSMSTEDEDSVS